MAMAPSTSSDPQFAEEVPGGHVDAAEMRAAVAAIAQALHAMQVLDI